MTYLTLVAKVKADPATDSVLLDAMRCATKVYNGLVWHLRDEHQKTGRSTINRAHLNRLMKNLPRTDGYYSLSVQATRDEVIQAYRSYFQLQKGGHKETRPPGFRRRITYSPLRYFDGYGFKINGNRLTLSLGRRRQDGVKTVVVEICHRKDIAYRRIVNILLTYDKKVGLQAHLVVEVEDGQAKGDGKVAVDLGETQVISAVFDDGKAILYSGRKIKSIRRYWQKVRRSVKPPNEEHPRKSRRYCQIDQKEHRQINHLLHKITRDFVERCHEAGVIEIAIGDLNGIRSSMDYGRRMNQRLHSWPYAKIARMIEYKARLHGIKTVRTDEMDTSQRCHACRKIVSSNRKERGWYRCECGWETHADINAAANLFEREFNVSPLRSSGAVAVPVVVPVRVNGHMVYEA